LIVVRQVVSEEVRVEMGKINLFNDIGDERKINDGVIQTRIGPSGNRAYARWAATHSEVVGPLI
jgi:hypothetical protein